MRRKRERRRNDDRPRAPVRLKPGPPLLIQSPFEDAGFPDPARSRPLNGRPGASSRPMLRDGPSGLLSKKAVRASNRLSVGAELIVQANAGEIAVVRRARRIRATAGGNTGHDDGRTPKIIVQVLGLDRDRARLEEVQERAGRQGIFDAAAICVAGFDAIARTQECGRPSGDVGERSLTPPYAKPPVP